MDPDGREDNNNNTETKTYRNRGPDINLFPKDEEIYINVNVKYRSSFIFVVAGHGNSVNGIYQYVQSTNGSYKGAPIPATRLAEMIKNDPNYKTGMTVYLWACNVGESPKNGKEIYAQKVADALGEGAVVYAPNTKIWINDVFNGVPLPYNITEEKVDGKIVYTKTEGGWIKFVGRKKDEEL